uniref:Scaffolding anchor of CK1 domain-containing protein n=1 Tax=Mola mola TaxID=94237 RepID=A0A3Q4BFD8_MOLML
MPTSQLSSLRDDTKSEDYIQPHYKESYRLAIDRLIDGGRENYQEFLKGERLGNFLSEEELLFITANAEQVPRQNHAEEINNPPDNQSSSGTYWPMHSDMGAPDLDLGWPEVMHNILQTNIDLLFHPPKQKSPTIKEVVRKHIQEARQVISIAMDMFTDIDIFKEVVDASIRGVPVYILLDEFHLKSFLTMAESQDVKIQQLRVSMRFNPLDSLNLILKCNTITGFYKANMQLFFFGVVEFYTWSSEKIHLSMVQVITGHLVQSYDEEFRTLYARSVVPAELCPMDASFQQILPKSHIQKIERGAQLRHTLDTVYMRTFERTRGRRDIEDRLLEEESIKRGPLIKNGISVQNQMPIFQSTEVTNFLKRHSYAGEKQNESVRQNIWPRASNWNIPGGTGNVTNNHLMDNFLQAPPINRGHNIRQSFNSSDKQVLAMQQNVPTSDNTSKSYMRTLRIESYLQNTDVPFGDSCDYLDQFEPPDKASSFMQGRLRSSLVFKSAIPEQMEPNRNINNSSTGISSLAAPQSHLHYSSMQWNSIPKGENRVSNEELMLKRQSLQNLDDRNSTSYGPGRNSYQSVYASLGRAKGGHMATNPDLPMDTWHKRHSMVDPRSNNKHVLESSGHIYGAYTGMKVNRSTAGINAQNGGYGYNLNEDQKSVSHYDVKSITSTKSPNVPIWQEPPSRTMSAAALHMSKEDSTKKSHNTGSRHFLKTSSKKIKSLLNIPDKKEESTRNMETQSIKSSGSTATLTGEDDMGLSEGIGEHHQRISGLVRPPSKHQGSRLDDGHFKSSNTRFMSEERHNPLLDKGTRSGLASESWSKDRGAENRLRSRYEPFYAAENKHCLHSYSSQYNFRSRPKGEAAIEHNLTHTALVNHENKLEKFFQRVGNFIHKNK